LRALGAAESGALDHEHVDTAGWLPQQALEELRLATVGSEVAGVEEPPSIGLHQQRIGIESAVVDGEALAVADVPDMLLRFPDLSSAAMRYAAATAQQDLPGAVAAFLAVLDDDRFHREQELLGIFRAALRLPNGCSQELAAICERHAKASVSELVEARALLAWGAHSAADDFSVADAFWARTSAPWRPYVIVAIQSKEQAGRDERYERWSGDARFLRALADAVKGQPFQWKHL